jgi:phosphoserine phosphatase
MSQSSTTKVILVRHGQSTYNAEKRYQGSSDSSWLTELGQQQAHKTQLMLAQTPIDVAYVSPLKRTQQTAQHILQGFDSIPLIVNENLREIDLPHWEGLPFAQVQTEFATDYQHWINAPQSFQLRDSDREQTNATTTAAVLTKPIFPVQDLYQRAQQFWQTMLPCQRGKTILIVSHGGTIRALTSTALGIPIAQFHYLQQSNTGITTLEFDPFLKTTLQGMNQTHHLGEVLPKPKHGKQGMRLILLPSDRLKQSTVETLACLFQSTPISFSLSSPESASQYAQKILKHHPQAISFEVAQDNFLLQWQQLILNQRDRLLQHHPSTPTNALIIAPAKALQPLIANILQIPEPETIAIHSDHFSSIFYPAKFHHPVLQSLNIPIVV